MRVLAADDDEGILSTLERTLRSWGYEVSSAHDGMEAWKLAKLHDCPPIVILDWDMPGITGLEVVRLLRATPHGESIYILMLTGRQEKADLIDALEAGADDFLSKPFHARELQLRLAKGVSFQASRERLYGRASAPPSASTLGGKYRLEKQIAEGGMASIWLGVHLSLGINVAIKFMKPGLAESPDYASFEREARAAAQLRTENIVRIYDHGIAHDGSPYLVMEYLAGESLGDRIDRLGPMDPLVVASIMEQIGRALGEAHVRGIIHRDIKPENILLVEDEERPHGLLAKLVDFGLARSCANQQTTDGGLISGTPSYMTPEHLRAQAPPNPALDMWGLAATCFTALTARVPFDGETLAEVMKSICVAPLPVPSTVEPALTPAIDAWFAKACARKPSLRFQTPQELASAFGVAAAETPTARTPSVVAAKGVRGFAPTELDSGLTYGIEASLDRSG